MTAPPDASLLVLAGPGSGKTRVVVHRAAWLLRVQRVRPRSMLIVCFNRANAFELRRRLAELVDADARGVTIGTWHGLAARLLGRSFVGRGGDATPDLAALIPDATALLRGERPLLGVEPDEQRDRLLGGFRYILVDEYQDVDASQYEFLAALAGRSEAEPEARRALFAVGDDDQAIYGFRGADVAFIRRFTSDYGAAVHELVSNYRSTRAIVAAAHRVIAPSAERMKRSVQQVDAARADDPPGGDWGLVQVLEVTVDGEARAYRCAQAVAVADELQRLRATRPAATVWASFAAIAWQHAELAALRSRLEARGVPVVVADELEGVHTTALREVVTFLDCVRSCAEVDPAMLAAARAAALQAAGDPDSPWWQIVHDLCDDWQTEHGESRFASLAFVEFARETLAEARRHGTGRDGVRLTTIHAAKGLEFDAVFVLDGGFAASPGDELEAERRLYYVAATRARHALCCVARGDRRNPHVAALDGEWIARRAVQVPREALPGPDAIDRYELLTPKDLFLDFAGRRPAGHPIHGALARLRVGAHLTAVLNEEWIELHDAAGIAVAALSAAGREALAGRLADLAWVRVVAVERRERAWCDAEFGARCKVDAWWLPVCELGWRGAGG